MQLIVAAEWVKVSESPSIYYLSSISVSKVKLISHGLADLPVKSKLFSVISKVALVSDSEFVVIAS